MDLQIYTFSKIYALGNILKNILFSSFQWERKAELDKFLSIFLFIGVIGNGA